MYVEGNQDNQNIYVVGNQEKHLNDTLYKYIFR